MNPTVNLCIAFLLYTGLLYAQTDRMTRADYFEAHKTIAVSEMHKSGVPASILLVQAALLSTSGYDRLAASANNHFKMTCPPNWTGEKYHINQSNGQSIQIICYKRYDSVAASYEDYANHILRKRRRNRSFEIRNNDYKAWSKYIEADYPNEQGYAKRIIKIIKKHNLHDYDKMSPEDLAIQMEETGNNEIVEVPENRTERTEITINNIPAVKTSIDDTPLAIARYYNISLDKLLKYNDLEEGRFRAIEQNVFLRPKRRKRCDIDMHTVKSGETMYSIAQMHGIRLNMLYKLNRMESDQEPIAGQKLNLCWQRQTKPEQILSPSTPITLAWQMIPPMQREQPLRRPQVPRVNNKFETIAPQFETASINSESSLY